MWDELKLKVEKDLKYHQSGIMQSMHESVEGEFKCKEILNYMKKIEGKYSLEKDDITEYLERIARGEDTVPEDARAINCPEGCYGFYISR